MPESVLRKYPAQPVASACARRSGSSCAVMKIDRRGILSRGESLAQLQSGHPGSRMSSTRQSNLGCFVSARNARQRDK